MSSIIEGYNYDIFISYRQKDNKGDRWVSEFVEALKTELEATFKEDVSVYFDENLHNRLQETHNVDKSLEGKLKCLIFIPILSQTYCDPVSYAWQYEFRAFLKLAGNDRFGKDIKLRSGNVASRILPIKIHDLEKEDIKLFEKETGSVLRSMDFAFRTATGVNRPLQPGEDRPNDNLNKTLYRDQINKLAHAIKEIILGMKTTPDQDVNERDHPEESFKEVRKEERRIGLAKPVKSGNWKLFSAVTVLAILVIAAILVFPRIFKKDSLEELRASGDRISVAVMPFQNMTNDTIWNVWQNGIQDIIVTSLSNSPEELKVRQTESINILIQGKGLVNYSSITPSFASKISQELDASIFVIGTIKKAGSIIRLDAQLTDSKTQEIFKSFEIDGPAQEDKIFHVVDSLKGMLKDFLIISKLEKEATPDFQKIAFTSSPEAYRYFIYGENARRNGDYLTQVSMLSKAIAIDSGFILPYIYLSLAYYNRNLFDQGKKLCLSIYKKRDLMTMQQKIWTDRLYALYFETPVEEIKYLKQLQKIDDEMPFTYYSIGYSYNKVCQYEKAIPEFEKALEIYKKWESKPYWVGNYLQLGIAYHNAGMYKKEGELYRKAEQDFPGFPGLAYRYAVLLFAEGRTKDANEYLEKYISLLKENSVSEADIAFSVGTLYMNANILDKAEEGFRESLSYEPDNPIRLNDLAYFLIEKDRNINEGLELIDKAFNLNLDRYYYVDCKGWGLYKQGKYNEALEFLKESDSLKPVYDHNLYLHLEAAKKAVASRPVR